MTDNFLLKDLSVLSLKLICSPSRYDLRCTVYGQELVPGEGCGSTGAQGGGRQVCRLWKRGESLALEHEEDSRQISGSARSGMKC